MVSVKTLTFPAFTGPGFNPTTYTVPALRQWKVTSLSNIYYRRFGTTAGSNNYTLFLNGVRMDVVDLDGSVYFAPGDVISIYTASMAANTATISLI